MKKMMRPSERIGKVKSALWFAQQSVPLFVVQETGMAAYGAVKAIIPALLVSMALVTLTTVVGAGLGAATGSLGAGVGAVPMGIAGGGIGFKAGLWILNILGLAFLIEYMGGSLWEATRRIERGVLRAWGPTEKGGSFPYDGNVFKASEEIALGVAIIIRCLLEGIVLYLTIKGVSKLPELVANLKRSKFGEDFGIWVEQNYQQMLNNPKLTRRVGEGAAKKQPARVLTDLTNMPEQPKPGKTKKEPPPLRQKYVNEVAKLRDKAANMRKEGYLEEEIGRTLHADRRALGEKYKELTPPAKLAEIYERNMKNYGDKLGPSIEWLRNKGNKSWEQIIESSSRAGGKDLGF